MNEPAHRLAAMFDRAEWMDRAACRDADPAIFFPTRSSEGVENMGEARAYCAICPVWRDCLEYALANNERHGIWGGLSDKQRRALKRKRAAARRRGLDGGGIVEATG